MLASARSAPSGEWAAPLPLVRVVDPGAEGPGVSITSPLYIAPNFHTFEVIPSRGINTIPPVGMTTDSARRPLYSLKTIAHDQKRFSKIFLKKNYKEEIHGRTFSYRSVS